MQVGTISKIEGTGDDRKIMYKPTLTDENGKVKELSYLAEEYDVALLLAICHKYLGANMTQHAVRFICRMLNINSEWSE